VSKDKKPTEGDFDYDVTLSFAGEDRKYVEDFAKILRSRGIRVFYDNYEKADLWGKDLYSHLDDIYMNSARYCILFVSNNYASKVWTSHERQSAQARAINENEGYILPARFDDTPIPGLRPTIGYIDLNATSPEELAELTAEKLGKHELCEYLPPEPDKLYRWLKVRASRSRYHAWSGALEFFESLRRTTEEERLVIFKILLLGCCGELPKNVHVDIDLLRRHTGFPVSKIKRILGRISSLGFSCWIDTEHRCWDSELGGAPTVFLKWSRGGKNLTKIAMAMISSALEDYCPECGFQALMRLDFSQLASSTSSSHHGDSHKDID
jgi:hypothetical protein